jgi:hypothetical protein
MATKINKPIVEYRLGGSAAVEEKKAKDAAATASEREKSADGKVVRMHEKLERPNMLLDL